MQIRRGLEWLVENQTEGGTWKSAYGGIGDSEVDHWEIFAVCRLFKIFFN